MPVFPTATTITATSVNSSHVFPISDGTARQEISPAQSVRAAILLTSTVTPVAADTTVFNDVSGSVIGSATIAAIVAAGFSGQAITNTVTTDICPLKLVVPDAGSADVFTLAFSTEGDVFRVVRTGDSTRIEIKDRGGSDAWQYISPGGTHWEISPSRIGGGGTSEWIDFSSGTTISSGNSNGISLSASAGRINLNGNTTRSAPLTPSQITSDQNNYAPGVAMFYRLTSDASRTITGLSVSQVDGQVCEIWNAGSNNIVLANESASSTAANRFLTNTGADITLAANEMSLLRYDSTSSRWRVSKV